MTTKVTVEPAGRYHIEVVTTDGGTTFTDKLTPGSPPRDFWVHTGRSLKISEVEPAA